jgi:TolB-like protein/Tfp pilus assembly protein PilF
MERKSGFFSELKRRRVLRTAGVYAVVAFVVAQVADLLLPALLLPDWAFRMVIALLILGFPIAVALAWSFDLTPEGVRRTEPKKAGNVPDDAEAGETGAQADDTEDMEPATRPPSVLRPLALVGVVVLVGALGFAGYQLVSPGDQSGSVGVPATPPEPGQSIAVLPLTNLAGGEENEYFADGVTEDILTNLGLVPDFAVISRSSSMRYKGSDRSIQAIAEELGVRYVLEGSLRRDGDRVRIVIQLVEPGTDRQIWAQTLDRRVEDVFAVQSEVAQAVVEALRVELTGGLEERMGRAPTDDFQAYESFLQGRDAYYRYEPQEMERAIEHFQEAIEQDPNFALAHAWLGAARAVSVFNYRADPGRLASAEGSARRAIELQPDLGDGHRALGTTLGISGRYGDAIPALERAIDLNPHDFPAIGNLGLMYALQGEWDRAIEIVEISIRRDPTRSYIDYANLGGYTSRLGLFDRTREAIEQSLALSHENSTALIVGVLTELYAGRTAEAADMATRLSSPDADAASLDAAGYALAVLGDDVRAREVLERLHEMAPDILPQQTHAPSVVLAHLLNEAGETGRAEALLRESERHTREAMERGDGNPALLFSLAGIATIRGERERALGYLEEAIGMGWNDPVGTRIDPVLAPLHGDPRFEALMEHTEARVEAMRERVTQRR